MRIQLLKELSGAEQAALPVARLNNNSVIITGSRPGELHEPSHFLRQAIDLLRRPSGQSKASNAVKVMGLIGAAAMTAQRLRRWSTTGTYDPLPDLFEIKRHASRRLGQRYASDNPVAQLCAVIDQIIAAFTDTTAEQRMGF